MWCLSDGHKILDIYFIFLHLFLQVSPEKMKEIQAQIDAERKALGAKKNMEEAERNRIAKSLEKRERDLRRAQ